MARQEADCRALAERKGWQIAHVYVDNDTSAYSGKPRPQYRQMLQDLEAGQVDAVVVWHLDRLHRNPRELEEFFEVCDRSRVTQLASVTGDIDLGTHDGRFQARILGAVARKESDDKSRRLRRKHEELAAAGRNSGGGTRPFGYDDDRVTVRPEEASLICAAARAILAGESLRSFARSWNDAGHRTSAARPWGEGSLRRMLMSARISGQREHHKQIVARATWPAIITPEQTAQLRALLGDPSRLTRRSARRYLLTGFLRCGVCGERIVSRPRGDKVRAYVCAVGPRFGGCGKIKALAEPVEQLVTDMAIAALDSPALAAAIDSERRAAERMIGVADEIDSLRGRLDQLARDWADGVITRPEWLAARTRIQAKLEVLERDAARERKSAVVDEFTGKRGALSRAWPLMSLDRQRAVLAIVVDHVTIRPAVRGRNRFDADRVDVSWRV